MADRLLSTVPHEFVLASTVCAALAGISHQLDFECRANFTAVAANVNDVSAKYTFSEMPFRIPLSNFLSYFTIYNSCRRLFKNYYMVEGANLNFVPGVDF